MDKLPSCRLDFSDVVFPGSEHDLMRKAGLHELYVIKSLDLVKVGIAANVLVRLRGMLCCNPHGIELIAAFRIPNAVVHWAEMYCHEKLLPYHHSGEWFRVDPSVAVEVAERICALAAKSRGSDLEVAKPVDKPWRIASGSPPGSQRMKASMRALIAPSPHAMEKME